MIILPAASTALILIDLQKGIVECQRLLILGSGARQRKRVGSALPGRSGAGHARQCRLLFGFQRRPEDAGRSPTGVATRRLAGRLDQTGRRPGRTVRSENYKAPMGRIPWHRIGPAAPPPRVTSVVIGGIATNIGVESTARAAHEHGYAVVLPRTPPRVGRPRCMLCV